MIDRLRGASGPLTSLRAFPSTDLQFQLTQLSSPLFVARDRCLRGLNTHVGAYVDKSFWSPQLTHFLSLLLQVFNYYMGKSWLQSMAVPKNITVPILIFGTKFSRLQASWVPLWVITRLQSQTPLVFIWVDNCWQRMSKVHSFFKIFALASPDNFPSVWKRNATQFLLFLLFHWWFSNQGDVSGRGLFRTHLTTWCVDPRWPD